MMVVMMMLIIMIIEDVGDGDKQYGDNYDDNNQLIS